ncbi:amino acid ABC transporter permease [Treponema primitia]|nr:amino acid ABC transporter permease [Treponema primitia]
MPELIKVLPMTLSIVLIGTAGGLILGAIIAIVRIEQVPVLRTLAALYVSFIRSTPIYIQMFVVYFGLPMLLLPLGIDLRHGAKIIFLYITYVMNVSGFQSEIIRSSILSVPTSQWDAATACGYTKIQTYKRIILPQSVIIAIPSFGTCMTSLLQDSALAFALGITDVISRVKSLGVLTGHPLEGYFIAGIMFITLSVLIDKGFHRLAKEIRVQNSVAET